MLSDHHDNQDNQPAPAGLSGQAPEQGPAKIQTMPHVEDQPIQGTMHVPEIAIRSPKVFKTIALVVIGLLVLAGLAYGGWYGYNYFQKATLQKLLLDSIQNMRQLKSSNAEYEINMELDMSKQKDSLGESLDMFSGILNLDNNLSLILKGYSKVDNSDPESIKSESSLTFTPGNTLWDVGFIVRTIDKNIYLQVTRIPSVAGTFMDTAKLKDKWIDLGARQTGDLFEKYQDAFKVDQDKLDSNVQKLKELLAKKDLFQMIEDCHDDTFEQSKVISCTFKLDSAQVKNTILDFSQTVDGSNDIKGKIEDLENEDWDKFFEVVDNMIFTLTFTHQEHYLKSITVLFDSTDMEIPEDSISKMAIEAKFGGYNRPQDIQIPTQTTSLEEILGGLFSGLVDTVMGDAREKSRDAKRVSDIKQIQTALELYFLDNSQYLSTSGEVILGQGDYVCLGQDDFSSGGCYSPYMGLVPSNPQPGGMDYAYHSISSDNYNIVFELENDTGGLAKGKCIASPNGIACENELQPSDPLEFDDMPQSPISLEFDTNCLLPGQCDSRRISDIKQIQTALELYFIDHDQYPGMFGHAVLGQGSYACLGPEGFTSANCKTFYMSKVPSDPQSGIQDYVYIRLAPDHYLIKFKLQDKAGSYGPGVCLADFRRADIECFDPQDPVLGQDTDSDGLLDQEETIFFKTNPTLSDTDSDGYSDGDEINNGFNPLGEGRL